MRAGVIAPTTPWVFAKASKFLGSWRVARGDISHAGLGGMTGGDLAGDWVTDLACDLPRR
jgi:hypothetical protein